MIKYFLTLAVLVFSYCGFAQPIGLLKTKTEILNDFKAIGDKDTKYANEVDEYKLQVLKINMSGYAFEYTFNADGVCFKSAITINSMDKLQNEVRAKSFEDYFMSEYKKNNIKPIGNNGEREEAKWELENSLWTASITKTKLLTPWKLYSCFAYRK